MEKLARLLVMVECELDWATKKFKPFNSAHEGYAVIKEEVDELWDAIKNNKTSTASARAQEALQVAAMALRYVHDLTNNDEFDGLRLKQRMAGRNGA